MIGGKVIEHNAETRLSAHSVTQKTPILAKPSSCQRIVERAVFRQAKGFSMGIGGWAEARFFRARALTGKQAKIVK
jgi:hypothetical protein